MKRTTLKAPFGWVGGKTKLARDIIDLIPQDLRPNYGRRVSFLFNMRFYSLNNFIHIFGFDVIF